jgi:site-specific DNA-methyltransferase (cytosine-N4-specific)
MIKVRIYQMHVLEALKQIPDNSIDCIVTSPPYWGLRRYPDATNVIWDGDPNCQHEWEYEQIKDPMDRGGHGDHDSPSGISRNWEMKPVTFGYCKKCGAWYGQLGLEPTLDLYIKHLLQITKELKRVLKPTGVMFWNHGDSYYGGHPGGSIYGDITGDPAKYENVIPQIQEGRPQGSSKYTKLQKCMTLQNYRLILKMIDEQSWILRNTIIWHKPNHLPSSVKDRFANAYEPIFMLTKSKKYYFNLDAVREPLKTLKGEVTDEKIKELYRFWGASKNGGYNFKTSKDVPFGQTPSDTKNNILFSFKKKLEIAQEIGNQEILGKNPGDVWTISTKPFKEAHFATFPEELPRRCIKAGCPDAICKICGHIRTPITQRGEVLIKGGGAKHDIATGRKEIRNELTARELKLVGYNDCEHKDYEPGWVLDPFMGSGTTVKVAIEEKRNVIGIEVVPEYVKMTEKRCNLINNLLIDYKKITTI